MRAAATVIISSALYCGSAIGRLIWLSVACPSKASPKFREVRGRHHVTFHPVGKAHARTSDLVPPLVKGIVARVVTERIGRKRAAPNRANCTDYPSGQQHGVRPRLETVDDLLDRHDRAPRRHHHLFLNSHDAP